MAEVPLNASAETLNPRVAAYLVGEGVLTDRATEGELDNHGFGMLLSPQHKLSGEKMLRLFDASGSKGLPNVARELNRSHIRYGRLAMNVHYNALTPNRGGEKAVSPGKIWKAVFNKSIPSGVDRDNLAAHIGETLERQATEAIRKENPGWDENEVDVVLFSIMGGMNYGLDPYRALEARTRGAGNLELSRNDFPSFETLPPPKWSPDEAIRNGMEMMGIDLPRRGKNTGIDSTITVGDRDPVLLRDTDNPLLTDPAEIADYGRGRVNNTVARTIAQSVTELLGDRPETRMQRAAVLSLFSQKSMGTASYLGMALGLAVSEHSPANMTVELAGDGVARLTIQSPPRDGVDFRIVYDIDQDGSARTTDVRVADFRAEPA